MLKYINFQMLTFSKKRANQGFVLWSLISILIINSSVAALSDNFIHGTTIHNNILNFLVASVFSLLIIVHVYLQGREDGTELLFSTKSLSRVKIYLGKAISSIALILGFSILMLLINWIPAVISSGDSSLRIAYVFSQLFGGFFVQLIIILLFAFITTISNKMQTIIAMLLATVFFPIFTIIATPITSGQPHELNSLSNVQYIYDGDELVQDIGYIDVYTTTIEAEYHDYAKNQTYSSIAPFDLWNQFNGIMNIFNNDSDKFDTNIVQKWEERTIETLEDSELAIPAHVSTNANIGAELIYPVFTRGELESTEFDFDDMIISIDEWFETFGDDNPDASNQPLTWLELFERANVIQRMKFVQYFIDGADRTSDIQRSSIYSTTFEVGSTGATRIEYLNNIRSRTSFAYMEFLEENSTFTDLEQPAMISNYLTNNQALIGEFLIGGETTNIFVSTDYINVWASLGLLLTISLLMFGIGGIVYNWKDFK